MNLNEMIEAEIVNGYGDANAQAKVCQDIILKAIASGTLNRNVTIKGGVVMRSKTGNVRRATQDLDMDFIRYSLIRSSDPDGSDSRPLSSALTADCTPLHNGYTDGASCLRLRLWCRPVQ